MPFRKAAVLRQRRWIPQPRVAQRSKVAELTSTMTETLTSFATFTSTAL
jgi:hypothetical protein